MVNRGLCLTCREDKTCCFSRTFPVLECEEFRDGIYRPSAARHARPKPKLACEEATEAE